MRPDDFLPSVLRVQDSVHINLIYDVYIDLTNGAYVVPFSTLSPRDRSGNLSINQISWK